MRYIIENCPFDLLLLKHWLVIENATLEDTTKEYECYVQYTVNNPRERQVVSHRTFHFTPGKIHVLKAVELFPSILFSSSSSSSSLIFTFSYSFPSSVYPSIEVVPMDRPQVPLINSSYTLKPGESVHWSCSAEAGVGDMLIWTLDGNELLHVDVNSLTNATLNEEDPVSIEVYSIKDCSIANIQKLVVIRLERNEVHAEKLDQFLNQSMQLSFQRLSF